MPVIGGGMEALFVATTLVVALILWLIQRRRRYTGPRLHGRDGIDRETLEAAEREVRDLRLGQRPEDEFEGDD